MNYPTKSDLLDMSLHSFAEHSKELLGKWSELTPEQRRELRAVGMAILAGEKREAA